MVERLLLSKRHLARMVGDISTTIVVFRWWAATSKLEDEYVGNRLEIFTRFCCTSIISLAKTSFALLGWLRFIDNWFRGFKRFQIVTFTKVTDFETFYMNCSFWRIRWLWTKDKDWLSPVLAMILIFFTFDSGTIIFLFSSFWSFSAVNGLHGSPPSRGCWYLRCSFSRINRYPRDVLLRLNDEGFLLILHIQWELSCSTCWPDQWI